MPITGCFYIPEAVVVLAVSGFPVEVTGTHESYFLFKTIGISLLMLCSSEIKVSVEITPGISCSLLFNSSIRWALSQAYSDEHSVRSGGEMAFHDFRNVVQFFYYAFVHRTAFENDTHVGTGKL